METPRLIIRPFTDMDIDDFMHVFNHPSINLYVDFPIMEDRNQAMMIFQQYHIEQGYGYLYALYLKSTQEIIGYIQLTTNRYHELSYGLLPTYIGQGYMVEACQACIPYFKQMGLPFVVALIDRKNIASIKIAAKLQMEYQYTYQQYYKQLHRDIHFRIYVLNLDESFHVIDEYQRKYPWYFEVIQPRYLSMKKSNIQI